LLYNTKNWSKLLQWRSKANESPEKEINKGFKHKTGYGKKRKH